MLPPIAANLTAPEIIAAAPTTEFDARWGTGYVTGLHFTRMVLAGLGMTEIQNVARELFSYGRDTIGRDQMGEIISATPGLSQFA